MVIKVLSENTAAAPEFKAEHGLSLFIETGDHKILFDTGAGGVFLENAKKLGVDIAQADFAVISHGHYDHGGGVRQFLRENSKALVFVHKKAFEPHYDALADGMKYIGLDEELLEEERIVPVSGRFFLDEGIELFSNIEGVELIPRSNRTLMAQKEGFIVQDAFEHEQQLAVRERGKAFLFTGCAHNGIVNIINQYHSIKKRYADYVVGGFHITDPSTGQIEDETLIGGVAEALKKTGSKYYTGHCTGIEAFLRLKDVLGENIEYIAAGGVLEI